MTKQRDDYYKKLLTFVEWHKFRAHVNNTDLKELDQDEWGERDVDDRLLIGLASAGVSAVDPVGERRGNI